MKLGCAHTTGIHYLDDPFRMFIPKDTDRQNFWRQSSCDVVHALRCYLAHRGCKDETDGVSTKRYSKKGIIFISDATNLYEHTRTVVRARTKKMNLFNTQIGERGGRVR